MRLWCLLRTLEHGEVGPRQLMAPQEGRGLNDVCAFVMALAERGVHVEATAVAAPGCAPPQPQAAVQSPRSRL